jgi:hypothetical protein
MSTDYTPQQKADLKENATRAAATYQEAKARYNAWQANRAEAARQLEAHYKTLAANLDPAMMRKWAEEKIILEGMIAGYEAILPQLRGRLEQTEQASKAATLSARMAGAA